MARLYITEYTAFGTAKGDTPLGNEPGIDQTPLTVGTVVTSAAFGPDTIGIRVHTDAICSVQVGANPVATTDSKRMAANATEYFGVKPGHKLSVIANT